MNTADIETAIGTIAPSWVRTGVRAIDPADERRLSPGERSAVVSAVPGRRAEFATGRVLLRELLDLDVEIPVRPDRRPELPDGVVGTLAHDRYIAVAATASAASCRALGIDIEPSTKLDEDLASFICRPEERHLDPHVVFVLKEAAYKAWSSLGGRMLEHQDVSVAIDARHGRFVATVLETVEYSGKWLTSEDRTIALVVVGRHA